MSVCTSTTNRHARYTQSHKYTPRMNTRTASKRRRWAFCKSNHRDSIHLSTTDDHDANHPAIIIRFVHSKSLGCCCRFSCNCECVCVNVCVLCWTYPIRVILIATCTYAYTPSTCICVCENGNMTTIATPPRRAGKIVCCENTFQLHTLAARRPRDVCE